VAAPLPVPAVLNPAAAGGKATAAGGYGGAAAPTPMSNHQQQLEEWDAAETMEHCNATCGAASGSSDEGLQPLPPCCRRPLKTLDLFPTKSTGLRDEYCSSSKSSSCSTSTN